MPTTAPHHGDDLQVLEAFAGARYHPGQGPFRRLGSLAAGVFAVVALVALATHDGGSGSAALELGGGQLTTPSAGTGPPGRGDTPARAVPAVGQDLPTDDVGGFGATSGAPASGDPASGSDPTPSPGTEPSRDDDGHEPADVAIVTPLLKTFAFGSSVGLPLLCSVAASAAIAQLPDENVAAIATSVVTACIESGSRGGDAIRGMNEQLRQLEAVNPATGQMIGALADTFNAAGSEQVPFAGSLQAMGDFIRFFGSSG